MGFKSMKDKKGGSSSGKDKKREKESSVPRKDVWDPPADLRARSCGHRRGAPPASSRVGPEIARRARPPGPGGGAAAKNPIE